MRRLTINGKACTEILALLVAMAWADERLEDAEKAGVRGAAAVLNLPKELRDRLEEVLAKPTPVENIEIESLSPRDRAFAYACAAWMATVDEEADEKEEALLDELARRLGLEAVAKASLERFARESGPKAEGGRHWSDEINALFKAVLPGVMTSAKPPPPDEDIEIEVTFDEA